jgi:glutathione S-transferase
MRKLMEFHRSPNSVKARIGLAVKALDYEAEEMYAADRAPMIEAAGWPLVPILLDGDVAMRDSTAILHYLDANYREGPSLVPESRAEILSGQAVVLNVQPEILRIQWSLRPQIELPEEERDPERMKVGRRTLNDALLQLEGRLSHREWLVGDAMSIYDIVLACDLLPSRPPVRFVEQSPLWRFYAEHFSLEPDRESVAAWMDRVLAWDGLEPALE